MLFPDTEQRTSQGPHFYPFKRWVQCFLSNTPGSSPDCLHFSNIMENGLAAAPANSFRTWDVSHWVPKTYVCSNFSSSLESDLLLQWKDFAPHPLQSCGKRLPVKTEEKNILSIWPFSSSVITSLPVLSIGDFLSPSTSSQEDIGKVETNSIQKCTSIDEKQETQAGAWKAQSRSIKMLFTISVIKHSGTGRF